MSDVFIRPNQAENQWDTDKEETQSIEITLNGITFHSADAGERFYVDNPEEVMTVCKVLTTAYPLQFKSHAARLKDIPKPLSLLSTSSRIRIIRAAQLHFLDFPVDQYSAETRTLLDSLVQIENGDRFAWSQYNNIKWALNYQDDDRAAAALLRLGMVYHKSTGPPCPICSQHRIVQQESGIYIEIGTPFTLQERINAACLEILNQFMQDSRRLRLQRPKFYFQIGCVALYKQNEWFLSLTPDVAEVAKARIKNYINDLFDTGYSPTTSFDDISVPEIEEPPEWIPDQEFFIPWSDFTFSYDMSSAKVAHNRDNALQIAVESLTRRLVPNGFKPNTPYHRGDLLKVLGTQQITRATRNGLFSSPKRGIYYLDFLKDIYDDKPETESEEE